MKLNPTIIAINLIFEREGWKRGFGRFDEKGNYRLSFKEHGDLNNLAASKKFPDNYYKLCDSIGHPYELY